MPSRTTEHEKDTISPEELRDGQIAVIIFRGYTGGAEGRVVQRHGPDLISIGLPKGNRWTEVCRNGYGSKIRLRVLKNESELIVYENE